MYRKNIPDPVTSATDPLIVVPCWNDAENVPDPLGEINPRKVPVAIAVNPLNAPDEDTLDPERNVKLGPTIVCFVYKY